MTGNAHLSDIQTQIEAATKALQEANQRKAELEKQALEKARLEIEERKIRLEREKQEQIEEHNRKVAAIQEARRLKEEAELKAKREAEAEERRLQEQADRLRIQQEERLAAQEKLRKIEEDRFLLEQEAKRLQDDLIRKAVAVPVETPQSVTSDSHPLGRILFANREEGVQVTPPSESTPVAVPEAPRTKRNVTAEDLAITTAAWRSAMGQNSPASGEIFELLEFHDPRAIIAAIKSFTFEWLRTSALPQNQVEHVRMRLQNTST